MMGERAMGARFYGRALLCVVAFTGGCASHSETTKSARSALDAGNPQKALAVYNELLKVDGAASDPGKLEDDQILYLLDRAVVLQQLGQTEFSSRDLQIADKRIEVLDFERGTLDSIGEYMFSDDSGTYQAPAYEKLLINTLNMMNYLQRRDLNGARIEARRFSIMRKFLMDRADGDAEVEEVEALSAAGSYLAGFIFERSGNPGEALRYYDEALRGTVKLPSLRGPVRRMSVQDGYRSPDLSKLIDDEPIDRQAVTQDESAEVLVVINYGRVPAKIPKRVPIGLALTYAAVYLTPAQSARANYLAGQGLVTWVNYPTLGEARGKHDVPSFYLGKRPVALDGLLAVDQAVATQWKKLEGRVMAAAITRMITRAATGEVVRRASDGGVAGALLSLATQATMTAVDTPDTRSWSTLPARITATRVRVPAGKHELAVSVAGTRRNVSLDLKPNGWGAVVLTVLR